MSEGREDSPTAGSEPISEASGEVSRHRTAGGNLQWPMIWSRSTATGTSRSNPVRVLAEASTGH